MNIQVSIAQFFFKSRREDFYSDLAEALADKADLVVYLQDQKNRLEERGEYEAALYQLWLDRMDELSFPRALRGTVPSMDVMILTASEKAGNLNDGLAFLALTVAAANKMKKAVRGELTMPAVMFMLEICYVLVFALWIDPLCQTFLPPDEWPVIGVLLHSVALFVQNYGLLAGPLGIALCIGVAWSMPHWTGRLRLIADKYVPFFTIYRDYTGSIFLVALAALMQSGVGIAESLRELQIEAQPWLAWHIEEILHRLDSPNAEPGKALGTGVFSVAISDRIEDFGKRSSFESALGKVGLKTIDKVVTAVTITAKSLNAIFTILVAATILFILGGTAAIVLKATDNITSSANAVTR